MRQVATEAALFIRCFVAERAQQSLRDIDEESDLFSAGLLDSLGLLELVSAVEKRFAVAIDFAELDLEQFSRIGDFAALVDRAAAAGATSIP